MARTVTYSVVPRIDPRQKTDPPKYYAQAQARGSVSIREMAERIQSTCTVHKTDVYAVLIALEDVVKEAIQNGEIVRLGELCTLQVGLSGKGYPHRGRIRGLTHQEGTNQLPSRTGVGNCARNLEIQ